MISFEIMTSLSLQMIKKQPKFYPLKIERDIPLRVGCWTRLHLLSLLKSEFLWSYENLKAWFRTSVYSLLKNWLQRKWADFYKSLKWFLRNQTAFAQEQFDDLRRQESKPYGLNFS